jgi:hypothetical protein
VLEEQERKEAAKNLEELKKKDMPAALMKINRLRGGEVVHGLSKQHSLS